MKPAVKEDLTLFSLKTALLARKVVSEEGMEADGCWFPEACECDISQSR